jgi:hypothetical protein
MNDNKAVNVIIASSGDIVLERKIVNEVCSGIGDCVLPNPTGISFNISLWEKVFSESETVKEIIKKLADECDIFVCILHKRFSCLIDQTGPDSLKEFLMSYDSWKSVTKPCMLFYFKEVTPSEPRDYQLANVLDLKEKVEDNDLFSVKEFSAPQEFCETIHDQMMKCAARPTTKL